MLIKYSFNKLYPDVEILTAESGEEGLQIIKKGIKDSNPLKFVISDIRMPELSGLDLARIVASKFPQIELILMTAYNIHDVAEEARNYGVPKVIYKSIGFNKLVDDIYHWFVK